MMHLQPKTKQLPLGMVGGNTFGRYPKVSLSQTYNMIISDGWLVPSAGYKSIIDLADAEGRGIYNSTRFGRLILVVGESVYSVNSELVSSFIATIETFNGDVFIAENDNNQIAICDKKDIYIFDYVANTFDKAVLDFRPDYIDFQDGYFIAPEGGNPRWRLSAPNNGLSWPSGSSNIGTFQTKPDNVVACVRFPGKGNQLFVFGKTVTEAWYDTGAQLFPYQRSSAFNIDYGCVNASTIASGDTFLIWLAFNEKSGPVIAYSEGSGIKQISNDGINFKLASLVNPSRSYGFLYKQDGHLFYQLTFVDPDDNFTLVYDFSTQKFFNLTDNNMNFHPAKNVAFYEERYYFLGSNDGVLYELNSLYHDYDGKEIPRIRICNSIRLPDSSPFITDSIVFTAEQGVSRNIQRVDLSVSRNGGVSFGNIHGILFNEKANYQNRITYWNLGYGNEFIPQFRFWGKERFVIGEGLVGIRQ